MNNKERIDIMREDWAETLKVLEKCRIFLEGLKGYQYLFFMGGQVRELLSEIESVNKEANLHFTPEVINGKEETGA